jgi:predicted 3-demethylubiquinone-9 3-methyltransferase (glyoxalase superfamily)
LKKLSAFTENEQGGSLRDKFGVSWQIVPEKMSKMIAVVTNE